MSKTVGASLPLDGLSAIVTGASRGIGRAVAEHFAACGVRLVVTSRDRERLENVSAVFRTRYLVPIISVAADVTCQSQVDACVAEGVGEFGKIDILVNCAAGQLSEPDTEIEQVSVADLMADVDIKVGGYLRYIRAVVPIMKRNSFGRIINVGGFSVREPSHLNGLRNAAIVHMTKSMSRQLGAFGITVNALHPGMTRTEFYIEKISREAGLSGKTEQETEIMLGSKAAIRRLPTPEEVAAVIAFFASPTAAIITGESLAVDGGLLNAVSY